MAENSQIDQRDQIIAELEADLDYAYRIIDWQQEQITQLQNQVARQQYTPLEKSGHPTGQTKRALIRKRRSRRKLSRLKFARAVVLFGFVIALFGLALIVRQNSSPSQPTAAPSTSLPKPLKSPPPQPIFPGSPQTGLTPSRLIEVNLETLELVYNVTTPPQLNKSEELQATVEEIVALVADRKLPTNPLSITLIDAKTGEYAEYQAEELRFPASVIKMFWMVYLYAQIEKGIWNEADFTLYLNEMINKSDNSAASYIFDLTTDTQSEENLEGEEYEIWLRKRQKINKFFQEAGYEKININQKIFPIGYLNFNEPKGSDLKMRGDPNTPIRNNITTQQAGRLLYEIYHAQAISPVYSQKMAELLRIEPEARISQQPQNINYFNPVRGYFSQSLPTDVYFGGKAGWTSSSRQEAAYIATPDGKAAYILVSFGDDRAYADDWQIFPKISSLVFERMINRQ